MRFNRLPAAIGIAALPVPAAAPPSGSCRARPPRPMIARPEPEKYRAVKEAFRRTARLDDRTVERALEPRVRLLEHEGRLPEEPRRRAGLPALAGRPGPGQLEGLEHCLEVRNRIQIRSPASAGRGQE